MADLNSFVESCNRNLQRGDDDCVAALKYLTTERGLSLKSIALHKLGFCRRGQDVPGTTRDDLELNVVMHGRVVVPIFAEFGRHVVGVAAREPDPKAKGWWNTHFDKQSNLFLFNQSRKIIFDRDKAYVFEGYFDGLVLFQEGLENAVSAMGTSLGYRRIGLLKRYCNRICLCYDTDENRAGQDAVVRAIWELSNFNFAQLSSVTLPVGVDPDEYVIQHGLEAFLALEHTLADSEIKTARRDHEQRKRRKEPAA